jgi:hypothetical protein
MPPRNSTKRVNARCRPHAPAKRVFFAVLALAVVTALAAGGGASGASKIPSISIQLLGPATGISIPRYAASPVFQWRIEPRGAAHLYGSGRLEVSTTASFSKEVAARFDCGYSPGDCMTEYQWSNKWPFWYDQADPCSSIPPAGNCGTAPSTLYWRVRYQPVGGKSWSSPVGTLRFATPADSKPPTANALPSGSPYGQQGVFHFDAADNGGVIRDEVQLFDGNTVVFGARTDWDNVGITPERLMSEPFPTSIEPGTYRWCLTVFDFADNQASDCSTYTITAS